jgi:predicted nucleic acid-binding protein
VINNAPILFADSNVFIEALFLKDSAAAILLELVAKGSFNLATCQLVIDDVETAILNKLKDKHHLIDTLLEQWEKLKEDLRLIILTDPTEAEAKETYDKYITVMRHKADIPVLCAALKMNPAPNAILSGNREHFNDLVSQRCGIYVGSCKEFLELISTPADI